MENLIFGLEIKTWLGISYRIQNDDLKSTHHPNVSHIFNIWIKRRTYERFD